MLKLLLLIFIIYLLYLVLRPVIRVWRTVNKVKQGDFSALGDLFGQPGAQKSSSAYDSAGNRKAGWTKARFRKKKIARDVGEYVKFSEVTLTREEREAAETQSAQTTYTTEQQITDIEWEDIK